MFNKILAPCLKKFGLFFDHKLFYFRFWRGMYGRFESGVHPREPLGDLLLASRDHSSSLEDHVNHLTKVKSKLFFVSIQFLLTN